MSEAQPLSTAPSIGSTARHDIPPQVLEVLATARATADVASRAMAAAEALLQTWSSGPVEATGPLAASMSDAAAESAGSTALRATTKVRDLVDRGDTLGIDTTDTALGTEHASTEPDPGR